MTAQHELRIITSSGAQYTSTPTPGSAAELAPAYVRILMNDDPDATVGFPTTDGSVVLRTRSIDTFHAIDLDQEAEALADCGDEA